MDTGESAHPSSFAALLRQYRLEAGLTQEALAERARLSRGAVSTLERGERQAPLKDTVALLAAALGLADEDRAALLARPARSESFAKVPLTLMPIPRTANGPSASLGLLE